MDTELQNLLENYKRHELRYAEEVKRVERYFSAHVEQAVQQKDYIKAIELYNLCPDLVTRIFICDYLMQNDVIERPKYFVE